MSRKNRLIILGGSGVGMIAADIALQDDRYQKIVFLNDDMQKGSFIGRFRKFEVLGPISDYPKYIDEDTDFFIAFLGLKNEYAVFKKFLDINIPSELQPCLIHRSASYNPNFTEIGYGSLLGPASVLSPDVTLESNCMLLGGSFVGHDTTLRQRAHLATNAVLGANITVGKGVHLGSNSVVREFIKVGDFALIGAGAVVVNDVPENSVVVGNPAIRIR